MTPPATSAFNDTTQTYACWRCGAPVPSGCTHHCPTGATPPRVIVIPPIVVTLPRIYQL
jgi:hypothetical protein